MAWPRQRNEFRIHARKNPKIVLHRKRGEGKENGVSQGQKNIIQDSTCGSFFCFFCFFFWFFFSFFFGLGGWFVFGRGIVLCGLSGTGGRPGEGENITSGGLDHQRTPESVETRSAS